MSLFSSDPISVEVQGQPLKCLVCAHDQFNRREASGASFFNLDWLNRSGVCYVCARCGYIHWFLPT